MQGKKSHKFQIKICFGNSQIFVDVFQFRLRTTLRSTGILKRNTIQFFFFNFDIKHTVLNTNARITTNRATKNMRARVYVQSYLPRFVFCFFFSEYNENNFFPCSFVYCVFCFIVRYARMYSKRRRNLQTCMCNQF